MAIGPVVGWLMDRFGGRTVILAFIPLWALALAFEGLIWSSIWSYYLAVMIYACLYTATVGFARVINSWFEAGKGRALGLLVFGAGVASAVGPRMAQAIADAYGWRNGFFSLAAISLLALPIAFLWMHERRETGAGPTALRAEVGYTRQEALRMPVFWMLGAVGFLWGLLAGGTTFFVPFLSENGLTRSKAVFCMTLFGIASMLTRPLVGFLIDRLHGPFIAAAGFLTYVVAYSLLGFFHARYAALGASIMGMSLGVEMCCYGYCVVRYFGLKSFGQISGLMGIGGGSGAALSLMLFSGLRDFSGTYTLSYLAVAVIAGIAAILMIIAGWRPFFENADRKSSYA
jgi:predicted MFS family arabinose efflux permease